MRGTGTRFAAAFLSDTFNPLRIGNAEVEVDNSYTENSGFVRVLVDGNGRIAWGIKADGSVVISKIDGDFTGTFTGDVDANEYASTG